MVLINNKHIFLVVVPCTFHVAVFIRAYLFPVERVVVQNLMSIMAEVVCGV